MVERGVGAERAQEAVDRVLAAVAALVERELLGLAGLADLPQPRRELVVGLLPGDPAPLAAAARSDALERVEQTLGVVLVVEGRLAPRTQLAARVGVHRVALDLEDAPVLHVAGDAADR